VGIAVHHPRRRVDAALHRCDGDDAPFVVRALFSMLRVFACPALE
jgi:hypothetical protein